MDALALDPVRPVLPATHAATWLREAWRLLRRAPLRMLVLSLLPIAFEALCQAIPVAGILLSKAATPLVSAWTLLMLDRYVRHGAFAPARAARTWRSRGTALAGVALLGLAVFGLQLAMAAAVAGGGAALALATGNIAGLGMDRAQIALVLASGMLPAMALVYAVPRIVLDGLAPTAALSENLRVLRQAWRPVGLVTLAMAALVAGLVWQPLLLLVLLPGGFALGYAIVRDAFPAA